MEYDISLCAAAIKPVLWKSLIDSLQANKCKWELILIGPLPPVCDLPKNVRYVESNVKPAQRQEASVRMARSEFIGTTVDDADFNSYRTNCPNALDIMLENLRSSDGKTIMAMSVIEEVCGSVRHDDNVHRFKNQQVLLLPYCSKKSWIELGGIDRSFWGGQWECDFTLNALAAGYKIQVVKEARYVLHNNDTRNIPIPQESIDGSTNHAGAAFVRKCWAPDGVICSSRAIPFEAFDDKNILTVGQ